MTETNDNQEKQGEKQGRSRSRLYPRYDLEETIRFVQAIHRLGGSRVSNQAVASEIGKAVNNSGFTGRISSAKQFGLITQDAGKLSETSLAKEIMVPRGEVEKSTAVKQALSNPDLYKELVSDFGGKTLPDQPTLANRLFHDYRIEEVAKDHAAKTFIRSTQYADALKNGILVVSQDQNPLPPEGQREEEDGGGFAPPPQFRTGGGPLQTPPVQGGFPYTDQGSGWYIAVKSQKPLNSKTKQKLIEVAELLDGVNADNSG